MRLSDRWHCAGHRTNGQTRHSTTHQCGQVRQRRRSRQGRGRVFDVADQGRCRGDTGNACRSAPECGTACGTDQVLLELPVRSAGLTYSFAGISGHARQGADRSANRSDRGSRRHGQSKGREGFQCLDDLARFPAGCRSTHRDQGDRERENRRSRAPAYSGTGRRQTIGRGAGGHHQGASATQ